ncbi:MAG: macro domain-containing protein [Actinomycetaceae bacterium]|nr:macro domain-containing protein [Actinomycetaceae bacterium]
MSGIEIRKISITDVETDAIVNAANDRLLAGGGVCGAIFQAAGYDQLQAACDTIGHCDTGSAVITPGFDVKAQYIIHAVGPRWAGGNHGEPQLLYGAYQSSLKLALENGCSSIAFPLISAGIFGYPVEQAWQVAIQACSDFIGQGNEINIVFAVLDDAIIEMSGCRRTAENRLFAELEKGRESGERDGWLTPEEVRSHFALFNNVIE